VTPYIAIDIETTGLDPATCQVIEFAAVAETDWRTPVADLPSLRLLVDHGEIRGQPAALAMNARLIAELCRPAPARNSLTRGWPAATERVDGTWLGLAFRRFVERTFGPGTRRVTVAGKNVATFDLRFLERLPGWPKDRVRHRVIDPGVLWWRPGDDAAVPDTAACMARAGVTNDRPHEALADCHAVIEMVRARFAPAAVLADIEGRADR
jgi:oligoribonuclease